MFLRNYYFEIETQQIILLFTANMYIHHMSLNIEKILLC